MPVARVEEDINGTRETFYYHTDHLGSIRAVTDEAGNIVAGYDYDIFGYPEQSTNDESLAYTTKGQDATGLYYFNARYYDPTLGRFISEDPAKDGSNWWIYCANNPLKYIDPSGKSGEATAAWFGGAWWLCGADGLLPIGDIIYVVTGIAIGAGETFIVYGDKLIGIVDTLFSNTDKISDGSDSTSSSNNNTSNTNNSTNGPDKKWRYGNHKTTGKWQNQMSKRGWTEEQIDEAIDFGEQFHATNNINPQNGATRYVHPETGRLVVVDNVTNELHKLGVMVFYTREEIYIRLLNEGTLVWCPTLGEKLDTFVFKVLPTPDYDPEDEQWEFKPGEIVLCHEIKKNNKKILLLWRV